VAAECESRRIQLAGSPSSNGERRRATLELGLELGRQTSVSYSLVHSRALACRSADWAECFFHWLLHWLAENWPTLRPAGRQTGAQRGPKSGPNAAGFSFGGASNEQKSAGRLAVASSEHKTRQARPKFSSRRAAAKLLRCRVGRDSLSRVSFSCGRRQVGASLRVRRPCSPVSPVGQLVGHSPRGATTSPVVPLRQSGELRAAQLGGSVGAKRGGLSAASWPTSLPVDRDD